ncbi:MAG: DegT/DnrJ/EryC1/StrS family aminotransferase [Nitrospinota bacterium]|jgi:dTDP-4-amino-4,6-dideoxygalactose transaminase|nr:DegT/DnrJ/EryC1/StrS family aminotransferase [Nitrospinota bacterium]MDP7580852.1 DegT/DnrJ/EryC1/StrS family aminotransferase [Nitrospinota bacterium]HJN02453.1 DegT/DnrJ/EryC1/StrS family aminotransferase [Nitrospinota bacterium]
MTPELLPFHQASIGEEEVKEIIQTLNSGWLTTGQKTRLFEKTFADYIGCKHAIGLNSCTSGLHLSLVVSGVSSGDEVITSPITFPATTNVIVHQNAKPVFVDVEPETLNINCSEIESKINDSTKAILPVHFAGHPCDMDTIISLAQKHNLTVIEDAAHALESKYHGNKIGAIGNFTAFSFYATKNITTGEGGMLTTNDDHYADKLRILSLHGISKNAWKRYGKEGFQHWELLMPGYKYNMFDVQASLGIHQIKKVESFLNRRVQIVKKYNDAFEKTEEIQLLKPESNIKHAHHLYVIVIKTENLKVSRDKVLNEIQKRGIGVAVHFRSLHLQPFFKQHFNYKKGMFPQAEYLSDRVISLPLYPKMTDEDVSRVIETVLGVLHSFRQ